MLSDILFDNEDNTLKEAIKLSKRYEGDVSVEDRLKNDISTYCDISKHQKNLLADLTFFDGYLLNIIEETQHKDLDRLRIYFINHMILEGMTEPWEGSKILDIHRQRVSLEKKMEEDAKYLLFEKYFIYEPKRSKILSDFRTVLFVSGDLDDPKIDRYTSSPASSEIWVSPLSKDYASKTIKDISMEREGRTIIAASKNPIYPEHLSMSMMHSPKNLSTIDFIDYSFFASSYINIIFFYLGQDLITHHPQ